MMNLIEKIKPTLDFDYMHNTYKNKIWLIICKDIDDEYLREEILQDVFVKFYDNITKFSAEEEAVKWLKTVAHNQVNDYLKKTNVYDKYFTLVSNDDVLFETIEDESATEPLDILINKELSKEIVDIINCLKPEQREVIYLQYYINWTPKEIAEKNNIPLNTVYSRIKAAKAILREHIESKYEGGVLI